MLRRINFVSKLHDSIIKGGWLEHINNTDNSKETQNNAWSFS
ncbi:hypothetical protein Xmir_00639 [Xenorhabdus miraniensis]|uniref:Uncharacterized protein n=1 Tax=Xenorhabdus miraniensis TaxID=351674 RepID=A0A2D0JVR8_9GAMM|nr:hypothetical protein Xmir_00639 [Xenorhabdus miraniensis]